MQALCGLGPQQTQPDSAWLVEQTPCTSFARHNLDAPKHLSCRKSLYIATYSPSRTASSEEACTAADAASMVGSPRSIRRLFTMSSVFSYSRAHAASSRASELPGSRMAAWSKLRARSHSHGGLKYAPPYPAGPDAPLNTPTAPPMVTRGRSETLVALDGSWLKRSVTFDCRVCGRPDEAVGSLLRVLAIHFGGEVDADGSGLAVVQLPAVELRLDQAGLRDEAVYACALQTLMKAHIHRYSTLRLSRRQSSTKEFLPLVLHSSRRACAVACGV